MSSTRHRDYPSFRYGLLLIASILPSTDVELHPSLLNSYPLLFLLLSACTIGRLRSQIFERVHQAAHHPSRSIPTRPTICIDFRLVLVKHRNPPLVHSLKILPHLPRPHTLTSINVSLRQLRRVLPPCTRPHSNSRLHQQKLRYRPCTLSQRRIMGLRHLSTRLTPSRLTQHLQAGPVAGPSPRRSPHFQQRRTITFADHLPMRHRPAPSRSPFERVFKEVYVASRAQPACGARTRVTRATRTMAGGARSRTTGRAVPQVVGQGEQALQVAWVGGAAQAG